jgi:hypothetical protein
MRIKKRRERRIRKGEGKQGQMEDRKMRSRK